MTLWVRWANKKVEFCPLPPPFFLKIWKFAIFNQKMLFVGKYTLFDHNQTISTLKTLKKTHLPSFLRSFPFQGKTLLLFFRLLFSFFRQKSTCRSTRHVAMKVGILYRSRFVVSEKTLGYRTLSCIRIISPFTVKFVALSPPKP